MASSTSFAAAGTGLDGETRAESQVLFTFPESGATIQVTWSPRTPERAVTVDEYGDQEAADQLEVHGGDTVTATVELIDRGSVPTEPRLDPEILVSSWYGVTFPDHGRKNEVPLEQGQAVTALFRDDGHGTAEAALDVTLSYLEGSDEHDDEYYRYEEYPVFAGDLIRSLRQSTVTAAFAVPSSSSRPATVRNGGDLGTVSGVVTEIDADGRQIAPPKPRLVYIAVRAASPSKKYESTWVPLHGLGSYSSTDAQGRYELDVPSYWSGKRELRVVVVANTSAARAMSSSSQFIKVKRTIPTFGNAKAYEPLGHRLDPCQGTHIRWLGNWKGAPKSAKKDMKTALGMVSEATGYTFTYAGKTNRVPFVNSQKGHGDDSRPLPRNARMLIAWATNKRTKGSLGTAAGLGGGLGYGRVQGAYAITEQVASVYNSAYARRFKRGFGSGRTLGELYLHELGHMFGLAHTFGSGQAMDYVTLEKDVYGAGDRAGLEKLTVAGGCAPDSAPANARGQLVWMTPVA